jgi:competence protein ComEC
MPRPRGDPVVVLGTASVAGALAYTSPAATVLVGIVALLAMVRMGRTWTATLATVLLVASAARGERAIVKYEALRTATRDAGPWPARHAVSGPIVASPIQLGDALRIVVDAEGRGRVALHAPLAEVAGDLARGDVVEAFADLAPLERLWNEGSGDPRPRQARSGLLLSGGAHAVVVRVRGSSLLSVVDRIRAHLRHRIESTFSAEARPMARALVLGEDDVAADDRRAFQKSGLSHLLAVSGMHVVLVVASLVAALRAMLARIPSLAASCDVARIASAAGLPVAWIYGELAGGSGSAMRAVWMTSTVLLARAVGRRPVAWRATGLSMGAIAIGDPLAAFDTSFVLSALATTGLLALARPLEAALRDRASFLPGVVAKPLAATLAATLPCAPLLSSMSAELPLGGLVANVVAVPIGEAAALPLCLLHALLAPWPAAERGCALAASGALVLVRRIAHAFAGTSLAIPAPTQGQIAVVAAAGLLFGIAGQGRRRRLPWIAATSAVLVAALEVAARRAGAPSGVVRATFLDVGQGDAALLDLPDGGAMLVDGGGLVGSPIDVGARALVPFLEARRRRRLDIVVLSHPHPDHLLGLASALSRVDVGALWDTGQGEVEGAGPAYEALLASMRARGVPVLRPGELCGARTVGGAVVEVLAPCPETSPLRSANDNSFVLRVRHGQRALLFVGDAEHEEEAELVLRASPSLRADVLKVGHHGSRTSSTRAFVSAVAPSIAVISCGVRNRFGHPHSGTLATFEALGVSALRTDREGSIEVTTDGTSLEVRTSQARSTTPMYGRFR